MGTLSSIYTIGHSTLAIDEFKRRLDAHKIDLVGDIRSHPSSTRHPHFNRDTLTAELGDRYVWIPQLGGPTDGEYAADKFPKHRIAQIRPEFRDVADRDRPATWWNLGLYEYAKWMASPGFIVGLSFLELTAQRGKVAIMCAEALWWKCHRSLVSDAWVALGGEVHHIMSHTQARPHILGNRLDRYEPDTQAIWQRA